MKHSVRPDVKKNLHFAFHPPSCNPKKGKQFVKHWIGILKLPYLHFRPESE